MIAIVEGNDKHVTIRNRITRGDERAIVSAYIYEEVIDAFGRSEHVSGSETQAAIEDFVNLMHTSEYIDGPSYEETKTVELAEVRSRRENVTLGRILGIQTKDAPIVTLAHDCAKRETRRGSGESVTVMTRDRAFAAHDPPFSMQYLPCPTD